jgi:hypothetical protein
MEEWSSRGEPKILGENLPKCHFIVSGSDVKLHGIEYESLQ